MREFYNSTDQVCVCTRFFGARRCVSQDGCDCSLRSVMTASNNRYITDLVLTLADRHGWTTGADLSRPSVDYRICCLLEKRRPRRKIVCGLKSGDLRPELERVYTRTCIELPWC